MLSPLYRQRNWDIERFKNSSKLTHPVSGKDGIQTQSPSRTQLFISQEILMTLFILLCYLNLPSSYATSLPPAIPITRSFSLSQLGYHWFGSLQMKNVCYCVIRPLNGYINKETPDWFPESRCPSSSKRHPPVILFFYCPGFPL